MLAPSPVVKKIAKDAMSKDLLKSIVVGCVFVFLFFTAILTASLIGIFANQVGYIIAIALLMFFAVGPLFLGTLNYFRRLIFEQDDSVLMVFKFFSSVKEYKRAMHFILLMTIRLVAAAVVLYLPCIVVLLLSHEGIYSIFNLPLPLWTSNLWTLNSFLAIVATLALVFVMLKYYLAPFIFVSNELLDPAEAVNMSTIISKRTGADFFGLTLSFAGWILLSIFIAPLVFTLPYFVTSYCVHSRFAITAYNRDVERFNGNTTPSFSTDEI